MNKYDLEMDIEYDVQRFWDRMIDTYDGLIDIIDMRDLIIECLKHV